jgi:hypothetical protein
MKNNMNFDAHNCFELICSTDKITSAGEYKFCRVSGISYMEGMIRKFKTAADEMTYFVIKRIPFYEIPGYFISGCSGLYFSIGVDISTELCYDGNGLIQPAV